MIRPPGLDQGGSPTLESAVALRQNIRQTTFSTKLVTMERQAHYLVAKATGSVHPISRKPIPPPALAEKWALKVERTG